MTLRNWLQQLEETGQLLRVKTPVSQTFQAAGILKKLEPRPVLFERIAGNTGGFPSATGGLPVTSPFRVVGNLFCSKSAFANYFEIPTNQIIPFLTRALEQRSPPEKIESTANAASASNAAAAPCQEVVNLHPDLDELPILRHCAGDGGNYISAGVFVAVHPVWGQNLDYHRCMQLSKTEMAVRVVKGRHFDRFLEDRGEVDVAVCIGNAPNVLAAGAMSVELGVDELSIANALENLQVVRAKTVDAWVPAETEFVLEGTVYRERRHAEGPFVDLTETYDVIRQEPVFVVKAITHRKDAIWQALLPGGLEHKLLMGMPREPTIFKKVNEVVRCLDVHVNPGGCSWLHAIVQIQKQAEDDGKKAIAAAFAGHSSCKHVYVVDEDIDIYDPLQVEWALATRFQADRDLVMYARERGSSLDPSSEPGTYLTSKIGFDCTRPLHSVGKDFSRAAFPEVDLSAFGL
jgi:2,5-furandicarboxylate decarboxylase 1